MLVSRAVGLGLSVTVALVLPTAASPASARSSATPRAAVHHGGFEQGRGGWTGGPTSSVRLSTAAHRGVGHGAALRIRTKRTGPAYAHNTVRISPKGRKGTTFRLRAWVKTSRAGQQATLHVRELTGGKLLQQARKTVTPKAGTWRHINIRITRKRAGDRFVVAVGSPRQKASDVFLVDNVSLVRVAARAKSPTVKTPPHTGVGPELSNGCRVNARGVPACGAYLGEAYGANTDPTGFEQETGHRLGIHRTYFNGNQVDSAVKMAANDIKNGRLPWISFKPPYSWADMAAGKGDAWAREIATKMAALPGPVWLAIHHEPESDGDLSQWRAMQVRLSPIIRSTAPNVAYTVILTGWDNLYGPSEYSLANIWPNTKVDVAGFDVYDEYGSVKNGKTNTKVIDMAATYFKPLAAWAARKGIPWGVAETGYTDARAKNDPAWIAHTYSQLKAAGGVALTYFNTTLNSNGSYTLSTTAKMDDFANAARSAPVLPKK